MNKTVKKRRISRILSALFMLLFLILSSIAIVGVTYADKAHIPDHVLNYDTNRLFWEEGTSDIYEDGTYRLNLFDSLPVGNDGMKIIAPGANDGGSMRLINRTSHKIEYTAAIFLINSDGVPITADFTNFDSLNRVVNYTPPFDIGNAKILRAVEGELDLLGDLIDALLHSGIVTGKQDGRLAVGQSVAAAAGRGRDRARDISRRRPSPPRGVRRRPFSCRDSPRRTA